MIITLSIGFAGIICHCIILHSLLVLSLLCVLAIRYFNGKKSGCFFWLIG